MNNLYNAIRTSAECNRYRNRNRERKRPMPFGHEKLDVYRAAIDRLSKSAVSLKQELPGFGCLVGVGVEVGIRDWYRAGCFDR
jgi:hypothetical protein